MKRLMTHEYDLFIEIEYLNLDPDVIMSSDTNVDGIPNSVQGDWEAFLINMEHIFHKYGFDIKDSHSSNRSDSLSQYYAVFPAGFNKQVCYEILIILRVSDHPLIRGIDHGENYYEKYAQENKYPEDKEYQDWEFEQILVNGHSESSYAKATREIRKLVNERREIVTV